MSQVSFNSDTHTIKKGYVVGTSFFGAVALKFVPNMTVCLTKTAVFVFHFVPIFKHFGYL